MAVQQACNRTTTHANESGGNTASQRSHWPNLLLQTPASTFPHTPFLLPRESICDRAGKRREEEEGQKTLSSREGLLTGLDFHVLRLVWTEDFPEGEGGTQKAPTEGPDLTKIPPRWREKESTTLLSRDKRNKKKKKETMSKSARPSQKDRLSGPQ